MVGDGDAMGVAGQVVENMFGAAEGWLGVDDPVLLASCQRKWLNAPGEASCCERAMELESVLLEQFT